MKQTFKTATKTDGGNFDLLRYDEGGEVIGLKDADDLAEDFNALIHEAVENLYDSEALELGNEYRDANSYDRLEELDEDAVNEALDGLDPWDILNLEIDTSEDYFFWDGYDFRTTCDVWDDIDTDDVADWVAGNEDAHGIDDLEEIIDEYNEALSLLEDLEAEAEEDEAEEQERKEREEEEQAQRARAKARTEAIAELVNDATIKALVVCLEGGQAQDFKHDLSVVKARLGVALAELFDEVTEYAGKEA